MNQAHRHAQSMVDRVSGPGDPRQPQVHRLYGVEPARQQKGRPAQPGRRLGLVTSAPPRAPDHPGPVRSRVPGRPPPPGLPHPPRGEQPPADQPELPAALVRVLRSVRQAHVRQDPPPARLLCLPARSPPPRRPGRLVPRSPVKPLGPRRHPPGPGCSFFDARILGPGRHDLLRTQLAARDGRCDDHARTARQAQLYALVSDIERRQKNLITRLEQQDDTGDPQTDQEYRQGIQRRFTELAAEHRARTEELAQLKAAAPEHPRNDPDLLTRVPQLPLALGALPEALQRSLFDAFQLQVRYHRPRHEVTIRVTIRAGALPGLTQLVKEAAGQSGVPAGNGEPDDARSHVLGAPGRIRTCAHGSGGHIHLQR